MGNMTYHGEGGLDSSNTDTTEKLSHGKDRPHLCGHLECDGLMVNDSDTTRINKTHNHKNKHSRVHRLLTTDPVRKPLC